MRCKVKIKFSQKAVQHFYKTVYTEICNKSICFSCKPCPVVKPVFLCGSDNRTYSSLCRLDYHNCIHHTAIKVSCKGFCPCKGNKTRKFSLFRKSNRAFPSTENEMHLRKKQRQSERLNSFMNKYRATLDKNGNGGRLAQSPTKSDVYTFTPQDFKYENKHYKYIKYTKYNKVCTYSLAQFQ